MKITIIDNDLTFTTSISTNLKTNYTIDIFSSPSEIPPHHTSDIYLLSLGYTEKMCQCFIEKFKSKIIILLAETYSHTYLRELMLLGAKEYIVKPFSMEEIERKIRYFVDKEMATSYKSYIDHKLQYIRIKQGRTERLQAPMIVQSNNETMVEKLVLQYCATHKLTFLCISLNTHTWKEALAKSKNCNLLYISNLSRFTKAKQNELFKLLKGRSFIAYTSGIIDSNETKYRVFTLNSDIPEYDGSYILDMDEYMKYIFRKFQFTMTDTKLAEELGISRKTLYSMRHRYNIYKNKNTEEA